MKLTTLEALYVDVLKELFDSESQLLRALPKMAKTATSPQLRQALTDQLHQTQAHVHRLDKIFLGLGVGPKGSSCRAMEVLIAEAKDLMGDDAQPTVMDAALIIVVQRLEHYEIAGYGALHTMARRQGYVKAANSLQEALEEKRAADQRLTELAAVLVHASAKVLNGSPQGD